MFEIETFLKYKEVTMLCLYILIGILSFLVVMLIDYYERINDRIKEGLKQDTIHKYIGRDMMPFMWIIVGTFWPVLVPAAFFFYLLGKYEGSFDRWMVSILYPKIKKENPKDE